VLRADGAGRRPRQHRLVAAPAPCRASDAVARPTFSRLLLTGAAGGLGRELRPATGGRWRRAARIDMATMKSPKWQRRRPARRS
jgi:hypothetical protein